eukprot:5665006-Amphidinium_carterae.1
MTTAFNKQKEYQQECQILLDRCNKLEEILAQAKPPKRDAKIWAEQSRTNEMKVIGLQRSTCAHLPLIQRTVSERLERVDEHIVLVDELGTHTGLIKRSTEEASDSDSSKNKKKKTKYTDAKKTTRPRESLEHVRLTQIEWHGDWWVRVQHQQPRKNAFDIRAIQNQFIILGGRRDECQRVPHVLQAH